MKADLLKSAMLLVPLVLGAVPASAQEGTSDMSTGQVAMTGSVAQLCILGEPTRSVVDLRQMVQTSGASAGRIADLATQSVSLPGSFCNFAGSALSLTASALLADTAGTPPEGFSRAVNYTATASGWGNGETVALTGAAADGTSPEASGSGSTQDEPKLGDINVSLSEFSAPSDALLIAGNYNGLVTITLGPVLVTE